MAKSFPRTDGYIIAVFFGAELFIWLYSYNNSFCFWYHNNLWKNGKSTWLIGYNTRRHLISLAGQWIMCERDRKSVDWARKEVARGKWGTWKDNIEFSIMVELVTFWQNITGGKKREKRLLASSEYPEEFFFPPYFCFLFSRRLLFLKTV